MTPKDELKDEAEDYDFTAQIYYKEKEIEQVRSKQEADVF